MLRGVKHDTAFVGRFYRLGDSLFAQAFQRGQAALSIFCGVVAHGGDGGSGGHHAVSQQRASAAHLCVFSIRLAGAL